MKEWEWKVCETEFVPLFRILEKNGCITDEEYISRGFPQNFTPSGREVIRPHSIDSREWNHRGKPMNHPLLMADQVKHTETAITALRLKESVDKAKFDKMMQSNKAWEEKLESSILNILKPGEESTGFAKTSEMKHFELPTVPELKAFVHCRLYEGISKKRGEPSMPSKKGSQARRFSASVAVSVMHSTGARHMRGDLLHQPAS